MYGFCGYSHSTLLTFEVFSARLSKLTFSLECKTSLTVAMPPDWHLFDLEWVRVSCLFFTPSTQHSSTPHGQSRNHPLLTPHPHTYSTSAPPHLHWPSVAFLLLMDVERLSIYDTDECNSATPLNATGLFYMTLMNAAVPPRWMLRDFFVIVTIDAGTFIRYCWLEISHHRWCLCYYWHNCLHYINDDIFGNWFLCVAHM
jgi:hypothetical protein